MVAEEEDDALEVVRMGVVVGAGFLVVSAVDIF